MNSPVCPDHNGSVLRKNYLICPVHLQTQPYKTLPDIESVTEALRFVESRKRNRQPYFLALGFHKPHINFRFPRQFLNGLPLREFYNYTRDAAKPPDMPDVAWNPYTDVRSRDDFKHTNISFPYGPLSELQAAQIRQAYYASVAYVDDLFGKLLARLDLQRTVVVVLGDHGWSLGEHAEWAKYSNFEVALRVPLLIHSPEFPLEQPRRLHSITELLDVFPTLVDLAHLPPLPACNRSSAAREQLSCGEGKSLYPQLQGLGLGEWQATSSASSASSAPPALPIPPPFSSAFLSAPPTFSSPSSIPALPVFLVLLLQLFLLLVFLFLLLLIRLFLHLSVSAFSYFSPSFTSSFTTYSYFFLHILLFDFYSLLLFLILLPHRLLVFLLLLLPLLNLLQLFSLNLLLLFVFLFLLHFHLLLHLLTVLSFQLNSTSP